MKKCKDYKGHIAAETKPDPDHPNSCYGCTYLVYISYEGWECENDSDHHIREIPYPKD